MCDSINKIQDKKCTATAQMCKWRPVATALVCVPFLLLFADMTEAGTTLPVLTPIFLLLNPNPVKVPGLNSVPAP
jgi:hypothetical protein